MIALYRSPTHTLGTTGDHWGPRGIAGDRGGPRGTAGDRGGHWGSLGIAGDRRGLAIARIDTIDFLKVRIRH